MPLSINGIGTTYYGCALQEPDGSYVVTQWVILIYLPIIPLGSKRVRELKRPKIPWWKFDTQDVGAGSKQSYKAVSIPLYMPHVIKGYAATIALLGILALILTVFKA